MVTKVTRTSFLSPKLLGSGLLHEIVAVESAPEPGLTVWRGILRHHSLLLSLGRLGINTADNSCPLGFPFLE